MVGCIFSWAYTRVVKGVSQRDHLISGWAYTLDLRYATLAERKPRQYRFLNLAGIPLVNSTLVYITLK